ncbi:MAG: hypothetical protein JWQ01_4914 [Massilia sp.]|nr:hypothetical protein [Massilia sp.]
MPAALRKTAPTSGTITEFIAGQIDDDLVAYPGNQAKYARLSKLYNIWSARRAQFVTALACDHDIPRLFYYGPHLGWMNAADFLIVLGMIDGKKTALERAVVPA